MYLKLLSALFAITLLISCEKNDCANSLELTSSSLTPTEGDDVVLTASSEGGNEYFQWIGPGLNETNQNSTIRLDDIKLSGSGTYYCVKSNSDCNTTLRDSVVIGVQLKQGTPPCSPVNNFINCSNIPGPTFSSVVRAYGPPWNAVSLYGSSTIGYPTFTVLFNSYNGNTEPRDGIYTTTDRQSFNILQESNEISISFIYASVFYHCYPGNNVYVSHINGKLSVAFCNLEFGPTSPLPVTTCTGRITQL